LAPGRIDILLPDFELGVQQPDLGEGEHLVRDEVEATFVDLKRRIRFFEKRKKNFINLVFGFPHFNLMAKRHW